MAMNRRNVLIGLGAVAVGGGAAFGSGAFSQVEAARTVDVTTTGDANGFIGIEGDNEYVNNDADSSSSELTIDLGAPGDQAFNPNAVTELDGVVTITNNNQEGEAVDISLSTDGGSTTSNSVTVTLDSAEVTFTVDSDPSTSGDQTGTIADGSTAELDVSVDTGAGSGDGTTSADLTIVAEDSSPEDAA
ncbi:hypothetical protein [Haloglomus litoreum]|uniref:hypothetical protein n=1 Tax=Haloglomus litoreum TaxID=3034026 RepID=UPI0023E76463|nr:hypothetical protein [Haloglomus sp. DT116]